jgi:hypothetical protein
MASRMVLVVCAWLIAAAVIVAQQSGAPRSGPPQAGSARISGRVIAVDGSGPLAGARVSIDATRLLNTSLSSLSRTATTDANGVFDFPGLPAGDYRLTATKTGYLDGSIGRSASNGGSVISVRDRQALAVPAMSMIRGGAINGRIFDEYGEPLARVPVHVRRFQYTADGRRTVVSAGVSDTTDDLGQFRVYGLPAGDYIVVAARPVGPLDVTPTFSPFIGSDIAPTYYPGTIAADQAQVVSLRPGADASVQFTHIPPALVRVLGMAVTSKGAPAAGLSVSLRSSTADWVAGRNAGTVSADGLFVIDRVAPGNYWIDVGSPQPDAASESASVPITVSTEELSGITIVTALGATVRGRVVFEGASPRPSSFQLRALQADAGMASRWPYGYARLAADGSFELVGVVGRVLFASESDGWIVKSVIADGDEKVDDAIDTTGRDVIAGVTVTVTGRVASIVGRVADDRGSPLADKPVVVMRTDQTGLARHRIRLVRTDSAGAFGQDDLRAGAYVAGVVDELEENYQFSPEFQERLRVHGRRFSLDEGQRMVLDLAPTPGLQ